MCGANVSSCVSSVVLDCAPGKLFFCQPKEDNKGSQYTSQWLFWVGEGRRLGEMDCGEGDPVVGCPREEDGVWMQPLVLQLYTFRGQCLFISQSGVMTTAWSELGLVKDFFKVVPIWVPRKTVAYFSIQTVSFRGARQAIVFFSISAHINLFFQAPQ